MKLRILVISIIGLAWFCTACATHAYLNKGALEAEGRWVESVKVGDIQALEKLFAPELIVISGSGKVENKKIELDENVLLKDQHYEYFATDDVKVQPLKDAAIVTGRCYWRLRNPDGTVEEDQRRYLNVWVKQNDQWRLVAQQMTRIMQ